MGTRHRRHSTELKLRLVRMYLNWSEPLPVDILQFRN
jgi:hypothetical protein